MAIEKYSTECIVINTYESGESDMLVKLYTREFGMILAKAASLRRSVKMRPHIQIGRVTNVTLVKGKEIYRIAGVVEKNTLKKRNNISPYIISNLNRFVQGEQKNTKLYDRLIEYVNFSTTEANSVSDLNINTIKLAIITEILIILGYLDIDSIGMKKDEYINSNVNDYYIHVELGKRHIVHNVTHAIQSSML